MYSIIYNICHDIYMFDCHMCYILLCIFTQMYISLSIARCIQVFTYGVLQVCCCFLCFSDSLFLCMCSCIPRVFDEFFFFDSGFVLLARVFQIVVCFLEFSSVRGLCFLFELRSVLFVFLLLSLRRVDNENTRVHVNSYFISRVNAYMNSHGCNIKRFCICCSSRRQV